MQEFEGDPPQQRPGLGEQARLGLLQSLRQHGLHLRRLMPHVLQHPDAEENGKLGQREARHLGNRLREADIHGRPVGHDRPLVLPQTDDQHLHQAAFDVGSEVGVGLDPVHQDDVIRLGGVLVHQHREPPRHPADLHRLHGGKDGNLHALGGHAIARQDLELPLRRGAAVAPHGRNNKRLRSQRLQALACGFENRGDVGDAAAAPGDGHAGPGLEAPREVQLADLGRDRGGDIRHHGGVDLLPDAMHLGKQHGRLHRRAAGDVG